MNAGIRFSRGARSRRGATSVEFALVAPLLFLLVFSLFEFAHLLLLRNAVENAAYEGCRQGIVPGATADEARATAESILRSSGARSFTVDVDPSPIVDSSEEVTVLVSLPFAGNAWLFPRFGFEQTLSTAVSLATERE